LSGLEFISFGF